MGEHHVQNVLDADYCQNAHWKCKAIYHHPNNLPALNSDRYIHVYKRCFGTKYYVYVRNYPTASYWQPGTTSAPPPIYRRMNNILTSIVEDHLYTISNVKSQFYTSRSYTGWYTTREDGGGIMGCVFWINQSLSDGELCSVRWRYFIWFDVIWEA